MANCPTDCLDFELTGNPTAGCEVFPVRKRTPSRLAFMKCDIALPTPFTEANTKPLFDNKTIVLSSPLANFTVNDPETEDIPVHDCAPVHKLVNRRTITFEDRIRIEVAAQVGPPEVEANPFYDYDYWLNKLEHRLQLRYGIVFCNGDFMFIRDEKGNLMEAWFDIFLSFQRLANNGGQLEFKKGEIAFQGDPFDLRNRPDFNLNEFGIYV